MLRTIFTALVLVTTDASAGLEFSGYMLSKDTLQFVVTDLDAGTRSGWIRIGDTFSGHKVSSFDSEGEVLVLLRDKEVIRLPLKVSRVKEAKLTTKVEDDRRIYFSDVSLGHIADHFSAVSGRRISVPPEIAAQKVTGRIKAGSVNAFLAMLPQLFPARVEVESDGSVQIRPEKIGPNKAPEPTTTSVTSPAAQEPRQP